MLRGKQMEKIFMVCLKEILLEIRYLKKNNGNINEYSNILFLQI